jgi:hypothetical protein
MPRGSLMRHTPQCDAMIEIVSYMKVCGGRVRRGCDNAAQRLTNPNFFDSRHPAPFLFRRQRSCVK